MTRERVVFWAATSTRLIVGAAVAVALVLAVGVAAAAPWPTVAADKSAVTAAPAASSTTLACTGPLIGVGRSSTDIAAFDNAGPVAVTTASASGGDPVLGRVSSPAVPGSAPATVTQAPANGARVGVAAAQSGSVSADDLRGFAASACTSSRSQQWLVGGAATTGYADVVVLTNPEDVPATVDITAYGSQGALSPTGGQNLVVPARSQRVLPLAGLVPGEEAPVLRVSATGAAIVAALQSSLTRTLLPGGIDQITATAEAATRVVIPGVTMPSSAVGAQGSSPVTVLRALSADVATTATVTVAAVGGGQLSTRQIPLAAGIPTELELPGLAAGSVTVTVTASAPVVAAVWQATGLGEGSDFAWYSAAPSLTDDAIVAVAAGPSPVLTIAAGEAAASVTLAPTSGGSATTVSVPASGSVAVPVVSGAGYVLSASAPVSASVGYSATGQLASYPVAASASQTAQVTVIVDR
jgi:hypothetical protein